MRALVFCAALLPAITVSGIVVKVEFDGSFRPPRDPGFPTIPEKMAVGAASVSLFTKKRSEGNSSQQQCQDRPVAIGCSGSKIHYDMTWAHAEYNGLILGL